MLTDWSVPVVLSKEIATREFSGGGFFITVRFNVCFGYSKEPSN